MLKLLEDVASTTKRKEKESILSETSQPDLIKRIALLTYDPAYDYYIKDFELPDSFNETQSLEWALDVLENEFNTRQVTGNAARERLQEVLSSLSRDDAEVLSRVVKGDLRCGASASTINKVWPETVYIHPYARCSTFNKKNLSNITLPCYSQVKMDGLYVDVIVSDMVEYRSRQGSFLPFNASSLDNDLSVFNGFVLMGEALIKDENGKYLRREDGNGIINSDEFNIDDLVIVVWDMVTLDEFYDHKTKRNYNERFDEFKQLLSKCNSDQIKEIETVVCHTKEEIIEEFKKNLNNGEEGSIIKDFTYKWKNGTIKEQIKMKIIVDVDMKVVGWDYGLKGTKYENMLGTVEVQSSDGSIRFNVGSGFTDIQREQLVNVIDDYVEGEKIVTVKGNGLVTNKLKPDFYALYLPRVVEFRNDKVVADSYDDVVAIIDAFTETLDELDI